MTPTRRLRRIALLSLLWSCTGHPPSSETPPPPPENPQPNVPSSTVPGGCEDSGTCFDAGPPLERDAGTGSREEPDAQPASAPGIPGSVLSPSGRLAFVWPAKNKSREIELHEVATKRRLTPIVVPAEAVARPTMTTVRWTAGDNILVGWSAGSDTSLGLLYSTKGRKLLDVMSSGMSVSPLRRYVATYPTLFAEPPEITLYDLSTGSQVARRVANADTFWSVEVDWKGRQLVAHCRDTKNQSQELRIDLDAQP